MLATYERLCHRQSQVDCCRKDQEISNKSMIHEKTRRASLYINTMYEDKATSRTSHLGGGEGPTSSSWSILRAFGGSRWSSKAWRYLMTAKEKTTPRLPSPRQGCIRTTMVRAGVASWWFSPEFKQQQPPRLARWQSISRALNRRPEDLIGSPYISEMEANPSGLASSDEFPGCARMAGWVRMGSRGVVSKLKLHVPPIWAM